MQRYARDVLGRLRPLDPSGRFDNSRPVYHNGYDIRTPYERNKVRLDRPWPLRDDLSRAGTYDRPEIKLPNLPKYELPKYELPKYVLAESELAPLKAATRMRRCSCPAGFHYDWCSER